FVGYEGKSLEEAKSFVRGLAAKRGREKAMAASEEVAIIDQVSKPPMVRWTNEVRKVAFQMLGPRPAGADASTVTSAPSIPSRQAENGSPQPPEKNKRKKPVEGNLLMGTPISVESGLLSGFRSSCTYPLQHRNLVIAAVGVHADNWR
ncbi:MAG: hypothetical protein HY289_08440, partial [Planctomycetes bacterium]|nr:hypothetical protein [Planctomycetota bacterium]